MKLELLATLLFVLAVTAEEVVEDQDGKRIVGGHVSEQGQYPNMVLIKDKETNAKICGGSIIGEKWVLTSASCVKDLAPEKMSITAGIVSATSDNEAQVRGVTSIHIHPEYDASKPLINNIAVLGVEQIDFNQNTYDIKMTAPDVDYHGDAFTAGWGKTDKEEHKDSLQMAHVTVHTAEECDKGMKDFCAANPTTPICEKLDDLTWDKLFCTVHEKIYFKSGFCAGDEGGALVRLTEETRDECIGVNSQVVGECGHGISLYTKLSKYVNWVHSLIISEEPATAGDEPEVTIESK